MARTIATYAEWLQSMPNPVLGDNEVEELIASSDVQYQKHFFNVPTVKENADFISQTFVDRLLNNPDTNVVPIRRKTKLLLVLNNFALYKPLRGVVFNAIKNMSGIFEEAMKKEGTMPFDSELGRMSEHVLVLLMRVTNYKFRASQVHEFAENNTQFAVQLLLAILLKEPPYEFELRCNCISGLLGFSQPQAFFNVGDQLEFNSCTAFSDKMNFISSLVMRLSAVQVINDVVSPMLIEYPTVQPLVHYAVVNSMRFVMNLFSFATQGSVQFRQHILLSTTFVDGVTVLYLQAQQRALESALAVSASMSVPSIAPEVLSGLALGLKFMAFATFHMGRHARVLRPLCTFVQDLLAMPVKGCLSDHKLYADVQAVYTQLLHMLCNIDALAGDEGLWDGDDMMPEMRSEEIQRSIRAFLETQVAPYGPQCVDHWHQKFYACDTDALVSQDVQTFQDIDSIYYDIKNRAAAAAAPAAPPPAAAMRAQPVNDKKFLADMPSLKEKKRPVAEQPVVIQQTTMVQPRKMSNSTKPPVSKFACALNGHVMKNPVTSKYGHTYEKDTIEQWIRQQGSVCPITGQPLSLDDLRPNKELQKEIMAAVIHESLMGKNQEDAVDLYDF